MIQSLLIGSSFALAAVLQPGPLQAFLISRAAADGWKRTLPAAFSPLLSDGPIAVLALFIVGQMPPAGQGVLRAAGGLLLLYLAWAALRQARAGSEDPESRRESGPRTLMQAATVNLLNPNPYLAWALVLGPAAVAAWRQSPAHAVVLLMAFYGVMVAGLAGFILLASSARLLSVRAQRGLVVFSAAILAGLGVYQLFISLRSLFVI